MELLYVFVPSTVGRCGTVFYSSRYDKRFQFHSATETAVATTFQWTKSVLSKSPLLIECDCKSSEHSMIAMLTHFTI